MAIAKFSAGITELLSTVSMSVLKFEGNLI